MGLGGIIKEVVSPLKIGKMAWMNWNFDWNQVTNSSHILSRLIIKLINLLLQLDNWNRFNINSFLYLDRFNR